MIKSEKYMVIFIFILKNRTAKRQSFSQRTQSFLSVLCVFPLGSLR
jgi:hypothetical protein